jgi:copper chaperone CopZ
VEKALKVVPGVTGVQIDLAASTATVEGNAAYEVLADSVHEAGYKLLPPI